MNPIQSPKLNSPFIVPTPSYKFQPKVKCPNIQSIYSFQITNPLHKFHLQFYRIFLLQLGFSFPSQPSTSEVYFYSPSPLWPKSVSPPFPQPAAHAHHLLDEMSSQAEWHAEPGRLTRRTMQQHVQCRAPPQPDLQITHAEEAAPVLRSHAPRRAPSCTPCTRSPSSAQSLHTWVSLAAHLHAPSPPEPSPMKTGDSETGSRRKKRASPHRNLGDEIQRGLPCKPPSVADVDIRAHTNAVHPIRR